MKNMGNKMAGVLLTLAGLMITIDAISQNRILMIISGIGILLAGVSYLFLGKNDK